MDFLRRLELIEAGNVAIVSHDHEAVWSFGEIREVILHIIEILNECRIPKLSLAIVAVEPSAYQSCVILALSATEIIWVPCMPSASESFDRIGNKLIFVTDDANNNNNLDLALTICIDKSKFRPGSFRDAFTVLWNHNVTGFFNFLDLTVRRIGSDSKSPLYIIQTSGSTGASKWVVGCLEGTWSRFLWMYKKFPFTPHDRCVIRRTSSNFVDSIWEIMGVLLGGGCLYMLPPFALQSFSTMCHCMSQINQNQRIETCCRPSRITILPSMLASIVRCKLGLKLITVSGDVLTRSHLASFYSDSASSETIILNLYGTTETSGDVAFKLFCKSDCDIGTSEPSLGVEIPGNTIIIVPLPSPDDDVGDVIVSGSHLAVGYVVDSTEEAEEDFSRGFSTGDVGFFNDIGDLVIIGRNSDSIIQKLNNGIRISLSSVEDNARSVLGMDCDVCCAVVDDIHRELICVAFEGVQGYDKRKRADDKYLALLGIGIEKLILIDESLPRLEGSGKLDRRFVHKIVSTVMKKYYAIDNRVTSVTDIFSGVKDIQDIVMELRHRSEVVEFSDGTFVAAQFDSVSIQSFILDLQLMKNGNLLNETPRSCGIDSMTAVSLYWNLWRGIENSTVFSIEEFYSMKWVDICDAWLKFHHSFDSHDVKSVDATSLETQHDSSKFFVVWKFDTGKCVDASACFSQDRCFIGSHSHQFFCVNLLTGVLEWTVHVGDRIEASATISDDYQHVYVGCYDGFVYKIDSCTGGCCWRVQVDGEIKSKPLLLSNVNLLIVFSYSPKVAAIDVNLGRIVWSMAIDSPVYASPLVLEDCLIAMTISGVVLKISFAGEVLQSLKIGCPIFSPPIRCLNKCFIFGCVDGFIRKLDDHLTIIWQTYVDSPIFGAGIIIDNFCGTSKDAYVVGIDDGSVCFLSVENGDCFQRLQPWNDNCRIVSSPCHLTSQSACEILLIAWTSGVVGFVRVSFDELQRFSSRLEGCLKLDGEIFSSPKSASSQSGMAVVVVGCRDDNVYCIRISL